MEYSEWSPCDNGIRSRSEIIVTQPVGAGNECPDLEDEIQGVKLLKYL